MTTKQLSKPKRWEAAASRAREAFDKLRDMQDELHEALNELSDVQAEYQDWYDNMPESLQEGPTGEKLSELTDIDFDIEVDLADYEEVIDNAENTDLPLGFGRD